MPGFDQTFGLQARHRFTNHGAADPGFTDDHLFGRKLFTALDLAFANSARKLGDQLLSQAGATAF